MPKSILITGGAGFVGSSLALLLKRDFPDCRVAALDNLKRRGSELNLSRLKRARVEFHHGDVRNPEDFDAVSGAEWLIDCAAEPSVLAGYGASPSYVLNTNLSGTLNCLEYARRNGASFIFLSTSRVYPIGPLASLRFESDETRLRLAEGQSVPGVSARGISEDFPLGGARSLYGSTKLASELFLAEYIDAYGIRGVINRCGVLTGPWQMGKVDQGVIVLWVASHVFGKPLSYIGFGGEGRQVRDILHVEDLYSLLRFQLENLDAHNGKVYNVGGGPEISVSLQELTRLCVEATGNEIGIRRSPENRPGDIPWYVTDTALVEKATGWKPVHSPREIVREITDWIREHKQELAPILA